MQASSSFYSRFGKDFASIIGANSPYRDVINRLKKGDFSLYGNDGGLNEALDDISSLFDSLLSIASRPRTAFKNIDVLTRSELSPSLKSDDFLKTVQDPSLWRRKKDGEFYPEYVHSTAYEEDISTYENKAVVYIYREAMDFLSGLRKAEETGIRSLARLYGTRGLSLSEAGMLSDIRKEEDSLSQYLFSPSYREGIGDKAERLERKGRRLSSTPLLKYLGKSGVSLPLLPTNIFIHDPRYRVAYRFYEKRLRDQATPTGLSYYFLLRFLEEGRGLGYSFAKSPVFSKRAGRLSVTPFRIEKTHFAIEGRLEGETIVLDLECYEKKGHAYIRCLEELRDENRVYKDDGKVYYACLRNISSLSYDAVEVESSYESHPFRPLYDALFSLLPHKGELSRCPACGSTRLTYANGECVCPRCGSKFEPVNTSGNKPRLWLKELF